MKQSMNGVFGCSIVLAAHVAAAQVDGDAPEVEPDATEAPPDSQPAEGEAPAEDEPGGVKPSANEVPAEQPAPDVATAPAQPDGEYDTAGTGEPSEDPYAASAFDSTPPPQVAQAESEAGYEPEDEPYTGPFSQGSMGLSIVLGSATLGESDYIVLGAGLSYYLFDGLSLGLDGDVWLGDDPSVYTLTPQARYVLYFVPLLKPYVGAFYRHYFIGSPYDDLNSVGGRAGVYLVTGGGGYLGLGALYEKFLSCDDTFTDCDSWYPELTVGFSL